MLCNLLRVNRFDMGLCLYQFRNHYCNYLEDLYFIVLLFVFLLLVLVNKRSSLIIIIKGSPSPGQVWARQRLHITRFWLQILSIGIIWLLDLPIASCGLRLDDVAVRIAAALR